jgi:hypothetical protein
LMSICSPGFCQVGDTWPVCTIIVPKPCLVKWIVSAVIGDRVGWQLAEIR